MRDNIQIQNCKGYLKQSYCVKISRIISFTEYYQIELKTANVVEIIYNNFHRKFVAAVTRIRKFLIDKSSLI